VYAVTDVETQRRLAAKFEASDESEPQLLHECKVYFHLTDVDGFPHVHYCGTSPHSFIVVMDRLGADLETLFERCNHKFSMRTILLIAHQMLCRVQTLHEKGFIHRDLKPSNFMIGLDEPEKIFLADMGLCKPFRDPDSQIHIPFSDKRKIFGTMRFMSRNMHKRYELSRRDDLESIGFVLLYFFLGKLPWQNMRAADTTDKYEKIGLRKQKITVRALCKNAPDAFHDYMHYCRSLDFDAEPNYEYLKGLFKTCATDMGVDMDDLTGFDWLVRFKPLSLF
jgi:serine/threonine protein kinase